MEIEINDETLDEVFRENLAWHINNLDEDLKSLRKRKKLQKHQRQDKEYFEKLLPALKIVGEYYGVK
jgi:Fic family protein